MTPFLRRPYLAVALALITSLVPLTVRASTTALERGFRRPPDSARPWVYYFIMDGNLSAAGITADFEALKRAGIGGVLLMEVDAGIPRGPVKFMSPEWRGIFKHAVREAERLGLELTLNAGPGWTGSGGPWVRPEQSMQHIVASCVEVIGPANFDAVLPRPVRRAPYFGNGGLPADLLQAMDSFCADVAVLAVPSTRDAARIMDIDEKALYLRHPYSSRPGTRSSIPALADYPTSPTEDVVPANRVIELTDRLGADGRLAWQVPPGSWTILRFARVSTGANTRPAPAPGLGLECDKFDRAALDAHFDAFIGTLLREIGPRRHPAGVGWNMLHIDSWEMGAQNWTAAFRDEFRRRRGYDPLRYLPAVTGRVIDSVEVSERFLWDLRQTAQELTVSNHAEHLKELGHQHGFGLSIEPYDMNPCADLSLGRVADVPMGEFWLYGFNTSFSVLEAASIAHTGGRPVVAAESFTSTDAERWQAYPGAMKSLGDWAFSAGINRIVFHRSQHQPDLDRRPGMTMGPYGVHWERTQTWWGMVPAYHAYLARCQFLLRQGGSVADICYLVAEGAPQVFRPPPSAVRGAPPEPVGYAFDACAPETLLAGASVQDGRLVLPGGASYRVLVLPERETMTPRLLEKVKDLVAAGATVVGPRPRKSPSLSGYPASDLQVQRLAGELWRESGSRAGAETRFGQGRVVASVPPADVSPIDGHSLERAKWIWHAEGNPAASAPVGRRFFRRHVTLPERVAVAQASMSFTADNSFVVWVNGHRVGDGADFHVISRFDVAAWLKPGINEIAVAAENGGNTPNPAGLIGAVQVHLSDGEELVTATDRQWESTAAVGPDWPTVAAANVGWTPAMELGAVNMAPWGQPEPPFTEPDQYGPYPLVAGVLERMGVPLDFASDAPLRFHHRRTDGADVYFVANRDDRPVEATARFRVVGRRPELWDPLTGVVRDLPDFTVADGVTGIPLRFESAQSFFVVFREPLVRGAARGANFHEATAVMDVAGPWEVGFDPRWGGPAKVRFAALEDWSHRPEPGIHFYSGIATYRKEFDLPAGLDRTGRAALLLDLGTVRNLARVRINGRQLGVVWCAPWRVDISRFVRATGNRLEIDVANLWPNRLIGDQSLPPEQRLTSTTWNPFAKGDRLLESGLLGPVTIRAVTVGEAGR